MTNPACAPEDIASEGLKPEEYDEIVQRLGRHPKSGGARDVWRDVVGALLL